MKKSPKLPYIIWIISMAIAVYTSMQALSNQALWLDEKLTKLFSLVPDSFHPFFRVLTELGDKKGIYLVAIFVLGWLLIFKRNYLGAAVIILTVALGNEVNKLFKEMIARPRPDLEYLAHVDSLSFPSGHAMVGLIMYFFIAYLVIESVQSQKAKIMVISLTAILLFLIGASRIILQVHYPTDVIGGFAYGYLWVFIWIIIYQFFTKKWKKA